MELKARRSSRSGVSDISWWNLKCFSLAKIWDHLVQELILKIVILKFKFSFVFPIRFLMIIVVERSCQRICVIMSLILITTLFSTAEILLGEIWCWSLLGPKGLSTVRPSHDKILAVKTLRGDKPHIFTDVKPLKTFYILLEWGQQHAKKTTAGRQINYCRRTSFVGVPLLFGHYEGRESTKFKT